MRKKLNISQKTCQKLYLKKLSNTNNKISKLILKIPEFIVNQELLSEQEKINLNLLKEEFKTSNQKIAREYLGWEDSTLFNSF